MNNTIPLELCKIHQANDFSIMAAYGFDKKITESEWRHFYPRNTALMKVLNLIDIAERAGSGIPNIYSVWKKQKLN
jgi:predicted HTH transcriptional regulator|nr:MAG TPA: Putative ATP-dependent DNA helicase recG C-terminal [Caudoviricetes sp.]